jgi:hypothetical protein
MPNEISLARVHLHRPDYGRGKFITDSVFGNDLIGTREKYLVTIFINELII